MLTCYWTDNFFRYHPDILPPNPSRGTPEEFVQMVKDIHDQGHLVMSFTSPVWWHEDSPTLLNLPYSMTIKDFARIDYEGVPTRQSWENGDNLEWGYYMSLSQPLVKQKLTQLMYSLKNTYQSDFIWGDGVGAASFDYDFNVNESNPISFNERWFQFTKEFKDYLYIPEGNYDRLAETAVGFYGISIPRLQSRWLVVYQRIWRWKLGYISSWILFD